MHETPVDVRARSIGRSNARGRASARRRLARSTAIFGAATALSRVLGLVREMIAAYSFGAAGKINAFTVAFQIPNLVRALVADMALSGAFVPVFSELLEKGERARAWRVASTIFWLVLLITTGPHRRLRPRGAADRRAVRHPRRGLRPGGHAVADPLSDRDPARAVGDRRRDPQRLRPVHGAGVDPGRVESGDHRRARPRRAGGGSEDAELYVYAGAIVLATLVQLLLPLPWLRGLDGRLRVVLDWRDPAVKRFFVLMLPVTLTLGLINVSTLIGTLFASRLIDPSLRRARSISRSVSTCCRRGSSRWRSQRCCSRRSRGLRHVATCRPSVAPSTRACGRSGSC